MMNDEQLLRYSRHILLPGLDVDGQQALLDSKVLIVGMGGLGCPAALYLAASGVGELHLADDDTVELSNLQRQIAHGQADIGRAKAESVADSIKAINSDTTLLILNERLSGNALSAEVAAVDVVVDASDNFATRFALNEACVPRATRHTATGAGAQRRPSSCNTIANHHIFRWIFEDPDNLRFPYKIQWKLGKCVGFRRVFNGKPDQNLEVCDRIAD